jgi:hypothetical protein
MIFRKIKNISRSIYILAVLLLALLTGAVEVTAQTGGFAGAYNRMGFGARGMGMGNAMAAVTQNGSYAHYNPALAAWITNTQFDASVAAMSFDRSLNSLNVAFELPPSAGINIGILHAGVSDFDGRSTSGNPTEMFSVNELNMFLAFGLRASERFSLGFTAKLLYADYFRDVSSQFGFGIDIGALYKINNSLSVAFTALDLLSAYNWDTSDLYGTQGSSNRNKFPVRFITGVAYDFYETGLLVSADVEFRSEYAEINELRESTGSGGAPVLSLSRENINTGSTLIRFGASYALHERVTIRGGWQINDLDNAGDSHIPSAGFSLHLPISNFNSSIDYTFMREPEGISNMHVFGLRITL